ncbi:MAG: TadE family protein [Gaiellales bacterium]
MSRLRNERGTGTVEFSLVALVLFSLLLGMAAYGIVELGNSAGSSAARDGARVGIIYYQNADLPSDPLGYYDKIRTAALQRLNGSVTSPVVTVRCFNGSTEVQLTSCSPTNVDLLRNDLIEVQVSWIHKQALPFISGTHTEKARMVISGKPDLSSSAAPTTTTTAPPTTTTTGPPTPPAFQSAAMWDLDTDGLADQVTVTFTGSGTLAGCDVASAWTLANIPSGGAMGAVSVSGLQATVAITEGTGAKNTAVTTATGDLTVNFSTPAGCSADSFAAPHTPSDKAGPVIVSFADTPGTNDGNLESGDTLTVVFSEPVVLGAAVSNAEITRINDDAANATFRVPNLLQSFDTGWGYIDKNKTANFATSTLTVTGASAQLTLGNPCSNDCNKLNDATTGGTFTLVPDTAVHDAANNAAAGSYVQSTNWALF